LERSPAAMFATSSYNSEEKKFLDYSADQATFPVEPYTNAGFIPLNIPTVGSAFYNRIGNKITMKSLHLKINIAQRTPVSAPGGNNQTCRWLLVYDRQTNGATPTIQTLLTDYQADGSTEGGILSGMNPTQTGRFIILREHFIKLFNLNAVAGQAYTSQSMMEQDGQWFVNWFVKLKDLEAIYQANNGSIGDVANGALWLVALSDIPDVDNSCAIFTFKSRLRFIG